MFPYIVIIAFILQCKEKNPNSPIWLDPEQPGLHLNYGNIPDSANGRTIKEKSWGPSISFSEKSICLQSHKSEFEKRESGPILRFCFPGREDLKLDLSRALNELETDSPISYQLDLNSREISSQLQFLSQSEIEKEISEGNVLGFFSGEERWNSLLREKNLENSLYNFGMEKNLSSTFSLPYFSFVIYPEFVRVLFPPPYFSSGNGRMYLSLRFGKNETINQIFRDFFEKVRSQNEIRKNSCSKGSPEITELMLSSSSYTGKFIEIYNPDFANFICLHSSSLKIKDSEISIPNSVYFLPPGGILVIKEPETRIEGLTIENETFWKSLKSNQILELTYFEQNTSYSIKRQNSKFGEEEFSYQTNRFICNHFQTIRNSGGFCGNPGIHLDSEPETALCSLSDFQISELNLEGLKADEKMHFAGKFLELKYSGNQSCTFPDSILEFSETRIPFRGIYMKANQNNGYLVLGNSRFIKANEFFIDRDLSSLEYTEKFQIRSNSNSLIEYKPSSFQFRAINQSGQVYSFNMETGQHHGKTSSGLYKEFEINNLMSPGFPNPQSTNTYNKLFFSEIHWAGSYLKEKSIPDDRFVELENEGSEGSFLVQYKNSSSVFSYLIRVEKEDRYLVLAKNSFQCFSFDPIWIENFPIRNEVFSLSILDRENILDKISVRPGFQMGIDDRTLKTRRSFVRTKSEDLWLNSRNKFISNDCSTTHASPGKENNYPNFLIRENLEKWKYISGEDTKNQWVQINLLDSDHVQKESFSIKTDSDSLIDLSFLNNKYISGEQLYLKPESGLPSLWNRDGMYISGLSTNPNSPDPEWVYICNRSHSARTLENYRIQDSTSISALTPLIDRINLFQITLDPNLFPINSNTIASGACAYLVSPNSFLHNQLFPNSQTTPLFTVKEGLNIGNGLGIDESIRLLKLEAGKQIVVHSYGNRAGESQFIYRFSKNEKLYLDSKKQGNFLYEYQNP